MATVANPVAQSKPAKAFYAQYLGLSGVITKPADRVLFVEPHSGAVVTLSDVEVYTDVVINGAVAETMAAYLDDLARGGAAKIATSREEGRA